MERMIAGGLTTRWPRPPSSRKPDTYGDDAACQITSLSNHGTRPFTEVALVGGHLYLDVMRSFVAGFREMRCVTLDSRSEEHTSELQSLMRHPVCRLLLEKKKKKQSTHK